MILWICKPDPLSTRCASCAGNLVAQALKGIHSASLPDYRSLNGQSTHLTQAVLRVTPILIVPTALTTCRHMLQSPATGRLSRTIGSYPIGSTLKSRMTNTCRARVINMARQLAYTLLVTVLTRLLNLALLAACLLAITLLLPARSVASPSPFLLNGSVTHASTDATRGHSIKLSRQCSRHLCMEHWLCRQNPRLGSKPTGQLVE